MRATTAVLVGLGVLPLVGCATPPQILDRTAECRRPVTFECTEAARLFAHGRRLDRTPPDGTTSYWLAGWHRRAYVVPSDAGRYNDAVQRCDTNQDGLITFDEATYYINLTPAK